MAKAFFDNADELRTAAILGQWRTAPPADKLSDTGQVYVIYETAGRLLADFDASRAKIAADPDLSPSGKAKAFAKLADEQRAELAALKARVGRYAEKRATIIDKNKIGAPSLEQRVMLAIQEMEIRRDLEAMDPLHRRIALRDAAQAADRVTLDAARNAPSYKRLAEPDELQDLERLYLEATHPEAARELAEYDAALGAATYAIDGVDAHISKSLPQDNSVAAVEAQIRKDAGLPAAESPKANGADNAQPPAAAD